MTHAVIVISHPVARDRFCGRTLVERHQELLRRAGVDDIRVIAATDLDDQPASRDRQQRTLVVTAERLFDPRLYAAALGHDGAVRVTDGGIDVGLEMLRGAGCAVPIATVRDAAVQDAGSIGSGVAPIPSLDLKSLDPYSRELRRSLRPYWMRVASVDDRPEVTRMLVAASGKGHQDLPAMLINAPLEKAAMRVLANTRVTPNQLTAFCNLVAYGVAALLATGHLLSGAVGALVVGVIDGLDGRQARIQVRTTPLGRIEHLLDKVYEVLWMVALAYALSGGFANRSYGTALFVWVAAYALDTAAYDLVKWRTGSTLDEASRLDALIRLVAGRRNVYACILLAGVLANAPGAAFRAIVWWSVVTSVVHAARAAMVIRSGRQACVSLSK
ncbi:MAG: hypothetical protein GEU82_02200 [Luteitalea sp.]|nr:hypothetical protein [Luteitalea sp.]